MVKIFMTPEFVARVDQAKAARRDALSNVKNLSRLLFNDLTGIERRKWVTSLPPMDLFAWMITAEDAGDERLLALLLECGQ